MGGSLPQRAQAAAHRHAATADVADPIDRAHLARYTLGNFGLEREVLGLFVAQLPLTLESLSFAETEREWQVAAHTLKGSARAVGAWKVASLAQDAEKGSALADPVARAALLALLEAAVSEVEAFIAEAYPAASP